MVAAFDDLAVLQHDDAVGAADGGQPVGDDQPGAALQQLDQRLLDQHLGVGIDAGRGLVEHQDLGVGHQRPRKADQLALAEREVAAALLELGVVAVRQLLDEVVRADGLCRAHHLFAAWRSVLW